MRLYVNMPRYVWTVQALSPLQGRLHFSAAGFTPSLELHMRCIYLHASRCSAVVDMLSPLLL